MLPKIPILRLPDSLDIPLPKYKDGVGTTMTLVAAISDAIKIAPGDFATVPTGFKCALPLGIEAQIRSLSPFSESMPVIVLNAPMTIDASNHDPIAVTLQNMGHHSVLIRRGQPIATLVFTPVLRILWDEICQPDKPKPQTVTVTEQPIQTETLKEMVQVPEIDEFSQSEIKRLQDEADKALESIEEIQYTNLPHAHSDEALLETDANLPKQQQEEPQPVQMFVPPEMEEIAQETSVPPIEVGHQVEQNALQDEINDETLRPTAPPAFLMNTPAEQDDVQTEQEQILQTPPNPPIAEPEIPDVPVAPPTIPAFAQEEITVDEEEKNE